MPPAIEGRDKVIPLLAEVFREHGYAGASLTVIGRRTGLGKGSLYHLFPGGKAEMAACVLAEVAAWFEAEMFRPLREDVDPAAAVRAMLRATDAYFRSGRRLCLAGVLALGDGRDLFADRIETYFAAWRDALADALRRTGRDEAEAQALAEEAVAAIQGGLVAARALHDPALFGRTLDRLGTRLLPSTASG